jgi:hypothetical protein
MAFRDPHRPSLPEIKPGHYSDGSPLDDVHYLECKLILKPDRFTSRPSFLEFGAIVRRVAKDLDIAFSTDGFKGLRPRIREVIFLDTREFALYNHAFILRRRVTYADGFPVGPPEIVFKFRHPDLQTAAELDVRPRIQGDYRVKFKAEVLPQKDKIGGLRMLYSHNVELTLDEPREVDGSSLAKLASLFPALERLKESGTKKIDLVNHTIVEEVLQDLGELNFGKGLLAKANAALWRERGDHRLLVGEFSFECKFKRRNDLHEKAVERCKQFFESLQYAAREWVSLGTTKTGIVYRLRGNPPQSHE